MVALCVVHLVAVAAGAQTRVAVVGDSTVTNPRLSARAQWPYVLERRLDVVMHVLAMPGLSMGPFPPLPGAGELAHALETLDSFAPLRLIIIMLGSNDFFYISEDDFRAAYQQFVMTAESTAAPIVCVTSLPIANEVHPSIEGRELEDYRAIVRDVCRSHRVVEGPDLMPNRPAALDEDGVHPSWIGARYIAHRLAPIIAEIVARPAP